MGSLGTSQPAHLPPQPRASLLLSPFRRIVDYLGTEPNWRPKCATPSPGFKVCGSPLELIEAGGRGGGDREVHAT